MNTIYSYTHQKCTHTLIQNILIISSKIYSCIPIQNILIYSTNNTHIQSYSTHPRGPFLGHCGCQWATSTSPTGDEKQTSKLVKFKINSFLPFSHSTDLFFCSRPDFHVSDRPHSFALPSIYRSSIIRQQLFISVSCIEDMISKKSGRI